MGLESQNLKKVTSVGHYFYGQSVSFVCARQLFEPLRRGCVQNLARLDLSGNFYRRQLPKELAVPSAWQQFFAESCSLQSVNLSNTRVPADAIKYAFCCTLNAATSRFHYADHFVLIFIHTQALYGHYAGQPVLAGAPA